MTTDTDTARISPADVAIGELLAFPPAALVPGRARSNLEETITKEWTAELREHAKATSRTFRSAFEPNQWVKCGNHTPIAVVRFGPAACAGHAEPDGDCEDCWPGGGFEVIMGDRRTLGCLAAGTYVLGYVAGDKDDTKATRRAMLLDRLTENRSRVGAKRSDEAQLVLDLGDLGGMSAAAIARAVPGLTKADVEAMRQLAGSKLGAALADKYAFMTFEQSAAMEEFDRPEDAETVKALVAAAKAGPVQFEHALAQARENKEVLAGRARFVAGLEAAGVRVYGDSSRGIPWKMRLADLRTADGDKITPEAHSSCPGNAVTIRYDYGWRDDQAEAAWREANLAEDDEIEFGDDAELAARAGWVLRWQVDDYLCTEPDEQGHRSRYGATAATPTPAQQSAEADAAARAAVSAERKRVITNNKAWEAASEIRAAHIKGVLAAFGSGKLPAAMKDLPAAYELLDAEARARREPDAGYEGHQIACELLGIKLDYASSIEAQEKILAELAQARGKRIRVLNLAMLLGGYEQGTRKRDLWRDAESSSFRWRGENPAPARHLLWLEAHTGYALSALEYFAAHGEQRADWTVERPGAIPGDQGEWTGKPDRLIGVACGHYAADPRPFTTAEQAPCHGPGCNGEWREITSVITPGDGGQPARDLATEEDLGDDEHDWDDDGPDDGPARQDVPGPDGLGPGGPDEINPAAVDRGGGLGNDGGGGNTAA